MRWRASVALVGLLLVAACSAGNDAEAPRAEASPARLMRALSGTDERAARAARDSILASRDRRFVAVFVELMRAAEIGLVADDRYPGYVRALQQLSGKRFGSNWPAWVRWYASTDLRPPPGFIGWKGRLLAGIDGAFAGFLRDGAPVRVRVEEVQWGGVVVDGIPALDNPRMVVPAKAGYLVAHEPVFGISQNGDSRAYPLRILDWHELANDVVGGVPVSLAYCTLCGAGIAYDGRASNGATYTFGSSGFLFRSNKLMYDRTTKTLWNQLTGKPVIGKLARTDAELRVLPLVLTTWASWRRQHPDTVVLDIKTGFDRPYELGAAYGDYFASPDTMFPVWQRRRGGDLPEKARVFGLRVNGVPKAYSLTALTEEQVVNDRIGKTRVVVVATRGRVRVTGQSRRAGRVTYDAGGEVRAYARGRERFRPGSRPDIVLDSAGRPWRVAEDGLIGPAGQRARRLGGHLAYWFGWYSFFPNSRLYR